MDKLKLYGVEPDKFWSVVNVRNQEETETNTVSLISMNI